AASPLATPSVTMGDDFDEVLLDDKPWAFHHGRTVMLPNRAGTYAIATRKHGADGERPHVVASRAVIDHCAFVAAAGALVLAADAAADRPPELPFTAVLAGPKPRAVEGGQLVDEGDLRHLTAGDRADAERAGTVIRFRPGIVRVRYGK